MKRNNKGFSLVELIVAIAIFAIAGTALVAFLSTTSNSYTRSNRNITLQAEQQVAVNQVRDMILECSSGIYFDDATDTLKIYGRKIENAGTVKYPLTMVSFSSTDNELKFGSQEYDTVAEDTVVASTNMFVLADHVTAFSVDTSKVKSDGKVSFQIKFLLNDKELIADETISLRNKIVVSQVPDEIWGKTPGALNSFITKISIRRGADVFPTNGTDTIGINGTGSTVVYAADVTANEASEREYGVTWSISGVGGATVAPGIVLGTSIGNEVPVTVNSSVPEDSQFILTATSIDDPSKYTSITITVKNTYRYADSVNLLERKSDDPTIFTEEGNGYRVYWYTPQLNYKNADPGFEKTNDFKYFDWEITISPLTDENGVVIEGQDPTVLPEGCSFDTATGKLVLSSKANGRTIYIDCIAKERNKDGNLIFASAIIDISDIPEYISEPTLEITVGGSELIRNSYITATMELINVEDADKANYTYSWEIEPSYGRGTTQWDVLSGTKFENVSLSFDNTEYVEDDVEHEMEYEEYNPQLSTYVVCDQDLNWSYSYEFNLIAKAVDELGNEIVKETTIKIPKVELLVKPTDVINTEILNWAFIVDSQVLSYEDQYLFSYSSDVESYKENMYKYNLANQKAAIGGDIAGIQGATTRRWFKIEMTGINIEDEQWNKLKFTPNYLFRNQIYSILNDKIVQKPLNTMYPLEQTFAFSIDLNKWEKLANRPVFMNYSVNVKDGNNSVSSDPIPYTIIYEPYGWLLWGDAVEEEQTTEESETPVDSGEQGEQGEAGNSDEPGGE